MIVKSISHEQRQKAAAERAKCLSRGEEPELKRLTSKEQAAHVIGASSYFMRPTKAGEKALGIEGHRSLHRVERTAEYLVGDKPGAGRGERLLHVAHRNFRSTTLPEQQAEMIALMTVEPGSDDAFEHMVISPGHRVVPTEEQMERVPARVLELLGLPDHQRFVVWHGDTRFIHCHIGANRIDPATGKRVAMGDGWLLDTIGQAIAQIEFEEGWPAEPNALYRADERGVFRTGSGEQVRDANWNKVGRQRTQAEKRQRDEAEGRVKLSARAAEYERRQRRWSDERAAKLIAWPIIRDGRSWAELHPNLAAEGMRYEKEGSGARLYIGDRPLTATTAHWSASIAKLEPRLGRFEPRATDMDVAPYLQRSLDGADQRAVHRAEKEKAIARKVADQAEIARAASDAIAALTREHQRLQQEVNEVSWSGRSEELVLARKLVGGVHREGREAVEENARDAARAAAELYRFSTFEAWLRDRALREEEEEEEEERGRRAVPGIILGSNGRHRAPHVMLPDYEVEEDATGRRYLRNGELRFVDHGNRIEVQDSLDRASVRDALMVAEEKWGTVRITGDRRFRQMAADLAAELDIKVANPELQKRIAQQKKHWRTQREAQARVDEGLRKRAEILVRQWPLLREQHGVVVVGKAMRETYRVSVEHMRQPVFQAVLRGQLARQKPVLDQLHADIAKNAQAYRSRSGAITLPVQEGEGALVRRQNWSADPTFMASVERSVVAAEDRQHVEAAAARKRVELARGRQVQRARMHGWSGTDMPEQDRRALLERVGRHLAAEEWDPRDYRQRRSPELVRDFASIDAQPRQSRDSTQQPQRDRLPDFSNMSPGRS